MSLQTVLHSFIYLIPVYSSLVCTFIVLLTIDSRSSMIERKVKKIHLFYYACACLTWASTFSFIFFPSLYIYSAPLSFFSIIAIQVVFYHLVFTITRKEKESPFSWLSYILPTVYAAIILIWSLNTPFDIILEIISERVHIKEGYEGFSMLYTSRLHVRLIVSLIYTFLAFRRLVQYKKVIKDFSADNEKSSLRWLYLLFGLAVLLIATPLIPVMMSRASAARSFFSLVPAVIIMVQHIVLCYNVVARNYVVINTGEKITEVEGTTSYLDKEDFERWMIDNKPYLNPSLKITDLLEPLQTNRSYLSSFINKEYGMNFNKYINSFRLEEIDSLRESNTFKDDNLTAMVGKAGFRSYRSYQRAKKESE